MSIAAELAATNAAASIGEVLKRRECRQQLAQDVWVAIVKRSNGRLVGSQGYLDPNALWEWVNEPGGQPRRLGWRLVAADSAEALSCRVAARSSLVA